MPFLEISYASSLMTEGVLPEEMARIIDHIRLTFPYRPGDHFYRSSSNYLVIKMAKQGPTRKQELWLQKLMPTLCTYPDDTSGCHCCNHPFDDAPVGICERCHTFDPFKVSSVTVAFRAQDFKKLTYLSRWLWGTIEGVYAQWTAEALAQLQYRGQISPEHIRQLTESGDHITPTEEFQHAGSLGQDPLENTLDLVKVTFMKQEYQLVQRAAELCHLDLPTFIRRSVWSSEAAWYVRRMRAATGRVHGCDLGILWMTGINEPLKQIRPLQIETEDVKWTAPTRMFNPSIWELFVSTNTLAQEHPLIATKLLEIVKNGVLVTQPEQTWLEREKKRFEELNLIPSDELLPCTEQEVGALETQLGYRLPGSYREMLLWIGHGAGKMMQDLDCFYEHLLSFQESARRMLTAHDCKMSLAEDAFVFFLNQSGCFSFIRISEGDDPPIYAYESTWRRMSFKKVYSHFSDFLAIEIEMLADGTGERKSIPPETKLMLQMLVDFNAGAMFPVLKRETDA